MKQIIVCSLAVIMLVVSQSARAEEALQKRGPVMQFIGAEEPSQSDAPVPAQAAKVSREGFVTKYHRVKNYQASFLADTVRLGLSPNGIIQSNDDLSLIIISDAPENVSALEKMLNEVDTLPQQIVIYAKVLEVSSNLERDAGMSLADLMKYSSETYQNTRQRDDIDQTFQHSNTVRTARQLDFKVYANPLSNIVNFLVKNNFAKVVSEPRIVTVNNKSGKFFIGDRLKMIGVQQKYYSEVNYKVSDAVLEENAGIILEVTPHTGESGFVTLDIKTGYGELSTYNSYSSLVSAREAESTIIVKSGEPVALGGYKMTTHEKTVSTVPGLGKIPLIKKLFTRKTKQSNESEMVIILMPEIITPGAASQIEADYVPEPVDGLNNSDK